MHTGQSKYLISKLHTVKFWKCKRTLHRLSALLCKVHNWINRGFLFTSNYKCFSCRFWWDVQIKNERNRVIWITYLYRIQQRPQGRGKSPSSFHILCIRKMKIRFYRRWIPTVCSKWSNFALSFFGIHYCISHML